VNCRSAREKMALDVSGDLPEKEKAALELHLMNCQACREEFEALKKAHATFAKMAKQDVPRPLETDFSRVVRHKISGTEIDPAYARKKPSTIFGWKPIMAISGAIVIVIAVLFLTGVFENKEIIKIADSSAASWEKISSDFAGCIEGPYKLNNYNPPPEAGVFAVLQKVSTDDYRVLYCDQSKDLASYKAYPWIYQRQRQILSYAGSDQNVYVAVCLKPQSSRSEREMLEKNIIEVYKPQFNKKPGS
jgi:hypothetical protein